jgi:hypothetical protein
MLSCWNTWNTLVFQVFHAKLLIYKDGTLGTPGTPQNSNV